MSEHLVLSLLCWSLAQTFASLSLIHLIESEFRPVDLLPRCILLVLLPNNHVFRHYLIPICDLVSSRIICAFLLSCTTRLVIHDSSLKQGQPVEDDGVRFEEVLVLLNEGFDEEGGFVGEGEVRGQKLCQQVGQKLMPIDNLVHVLIVLAGLPNQVIDRLTRQQTFKALKVFNLLITLLALNLRQQSRALNVAIVPACLALQHSFLLALLYLMFHRRALLPSHVVHLRHNSNK